MKRHRRQADGQHGQRHAPQHSQQWARARRREDTLHTNSRTAPFPSHPLTTQDTPVTGSVRFPHQTLLDFPSTSRVSHSSIPTLSAWSEHQIPQAHGSAHRPALSSDASHIPNSYKPGSPASSPQVQFTGCSIHRTEAGTLLTLLAPCTRYNSGTSRRRQTQAGAGHWGGHPPCLPTTGSSWCPAPF